MEFSKEVLQKQSGYSGHFSVEFRDDIAIIHMKCGENRVNFSFIDRLNKALDEVERNKDAKAVILTGEKKFFSNGMDLTWFSYILHNRSSTDFTRVLKSLMSLNWRLITFPMPTIAALNGHTFAGGALVALLCDTRIMNRTKGWFCLNEIHLGMVFSKSTEYLLKLRLPNGQVFHDAVVMGKRYTGPEALQSGIVSGIGKDNDLILTAITTAKEMLKPGVYDRSNLQSMKSSIFKEYLATSERELVSGQTNLGFASKL